MQLEEEEQRDESPPEIRSSLVVKSKIMSEQPIIEEMGSGDSYFDSSL